MRGSHLPERTRRKGRRSIPASAGQPVSSCRECQRAEVYPRECGAAQYLLAQHVFVIGLSPRVRGSPFTPRVSVIVIRSIPASAGQPRADEHYIASSRVYPRECGAAAGAFGITPSAAGLSPRVRGSPFSRRRVLRFLGSIPASAGQPFQVGNDACSTQVYPRECGAALYGGISQRTMMGLSPRVRGSLLPMLLYQDGLRSIPASAGQPHRRNADAYKFAVYPRECGAALYGGISQRTMMGLSPRVRGSLLPMLLYQDGLRSIPASAGQPKRCYQYRTYKQVYPRECGAAAAAMPSSRSTSGLSPRVRGSRLACVQRGVRGRSIPASAGQPLRDTATCAAHRVYPRECGAACPNQQ